jgi:type VI secretion system secreted protein VgrG
MTNKEPQIKISYFEERLIDYRVIECIILEGLSKPIEIETLIFFTKKHIWEVDIELGFETKIYIKQYIKENIIIREYECFIEKSEKTKYLKEDSLLYCEYLLKINFSHQLKKLHYRNNYTLWNNKTYGHVLLEILNFHKIELTGNLFALMKSEIEIIVQYGETDLDFFSRILQFFGYYYYCDEKLPIVKIFDSDIGYEEIVVDNLEEYKISHKRNFQMGTIFYINEIKKLTYEKFINRDFNIKIPLNLEGATINESLTYGELLTYPSNSINSIEIEKAVTNKKKIFIDKKYEGQSYCFNFKCGKRIFINDILNEKPQVIISVNHYFIVDTKNSNYTLYNYWNDFQTISSEKIYVSENIYLEPKISSMQVGIVKTSIEGEEIYLKDFSKVLIKLSWVKDDPELYCWVPVAQNMCGKGFGSFIMPRKEDEVLIYFINGNPSTPVIYGSLHTDKNPRFCGETDDKYKIFLMKSHTFYNEKFTSSNEISMSDKLDEQLLFLKAEKDLNIEIGNKGKSLENNYKTAILGIGNKIDYIENGEYKIILENGDLIKEIKGNQETRIFRGEKGGDKRIFISDGKLQIGVDGEGGIHIETSGPCILRTDNSMKIQAIGRIDIESGEEIRMAAPKIKIIGEEEVNIEAGQIIGMKSGIEIIEEAVERINRKSGMEMIDEAGEKIIRRSGMEIVDEAAMRIGSVSGGEIILDASSLLSGRSGMEMLFDSGVNMSINSGVRVGIESGVIVDLNSGVEINIDSGVSTGIRGGVDVTIDGGLSVGINSGISVHIESGVEVEIASGVSVNVDSGVQLGLCSGLVLTAASGLEITVDSGLSINITAGMFFEVFASILVSITTIFEVVVRRPRL